MTVDEDGVRTATATMDAHLAWGAFGSYVETDRLFVLRGPQRAGIRGGWIAKRGAPDQISLDRLRTLLDQHLQRV
ncbi:YcxB family protein [Streptomyces abyssomicinicus]|uniref:YcxB family protein n=1 Tax=Streptomyces abyssomicinicus TaxID=574929 RepID=UPI00124FC475|nr:YcxB family protein [Streptomyces abyssomicinicus]